MDLIFIKNDNYIKNTNKMKPIKNIIEGFIYVKEHPILPGLYLLDIGVTVVSFYRQIMPLIADRLFKGGAAIISLLTAFNSIGAIAGSFLVVFFSKIKSKVKNNINNTIDLKYEIELGQKAYISSIKFIGDKKIISFLELKKLSKQNTISNIVISIPSNSKLPFVGFSSPLNNDKNSS